VNPPDLLAPSFYADIDGMHESLRTMRAAGPVWRDEKNHLWAVVHHAPLVEVERRADVFSSSGCYRSRVAPQEEDMIAKDDPAHHAQRALVSRRFTPKAVERLEAAIDATVDDLVDGFIDRGELEGALKTLEAEAASQRERAQRLQGAERDQALADLAGTERRRAVAAAKLAAIAAAAH